MKEMKKSNVVQYVLIGLLIVAAFLIGSLWTKVGVLETKGGTGSGIAVKDTGTPAAAGETAAVVDVAAMAKDAGLNADDFQTCTKSKEAADLVAADEATGATAGVQGTPGAFIVDTQTGKGVEVPGAVPYTNLKTLMDQVIAGTNLTALKVTAITPSDHVRGDKLARYALIEYSDYDCPYCKQFSTTITKLLTDYSGKVKWAYRQMPLDQLHPTTRVKSIAAMCAAKLGGDDAFWKFTDTFLKN